jgi:hypothetical protein
VNVNPKLPVKEAIRTWLQTTKDDDQGEDVMKFRIFAVCLVASLAIAAHPSVNGQQADTEGHRSKLVKFDAPGATKKSTPACAPSCGTFAYTNNDLGAIVGYYTDPQVVPHGFLRTPDGHFTSFNAPGDGEGAGLNQGTVAIAINNLGAITGQFEDAMDIYHGFIREPDGKITSFDAPGAGTAANQGTIASSINLEGAALGIYIDQGNTQHGFLRSHDSVISTIDPTGSVATLICEETCLNTEGKITGSYVDSGGIVHGFVRAADGTFTVFDAPGAVGLTIAASINDEGTIAGYFGDAKSLLHGFIRTCDGNFSTFHVPQGGTSAGQGTAVFSINLLGAVTGIFLDANNVLHGYSKLPHGGFTPIYAPGAGAGAGQGTRPSTNNLEGDVTGWWIDSDNLNHGFVWYADEKHSAEDDSGQDQ